MLAENTLLSALEESGREIAQLQAELREVRAALEVAQRDLKIAKDGATALLRRAERAERELQRMNGGQTGGQTGENSRFALLEIE